MTFKNKLEQHDSLHADISEVLTDFVHWLDTITYYKDIDLEYGNKYSVGSTGEEYISHVVSGDSITIYTEYEDGWDKQCDSHTDTTVPISWVEAFAKGEKESVEDEIIQDIIASDEEQYRNEVEYAKTLATRFGLIKE